MKDTIVREIQAQLFRLTIAARDDQPDVLEHIEAIMANVKAVATPDAPIPVITAQAPATSNSLVTDAAHANA